MYRDVQRENNGWEQLKKTNKKTRSGGIDLFTQNDI